MREDGGCATDPREVSVAPGSTTVVSMALSELRRNIVAELRRDWMRRIRFRCGSTYVDHHQYAAIACAIELGHIHVDVSRSDIPGSACYSATYAARTAQRDAFAENTLYLRSDFSFGSVRKLALLIHEATHAIQDYQRLTDVAAITRGDAECAAFTAQALYCLVRGTTLPAVSQEWRDQGHPALPGGDALISAAHAAAHRMFHDPAHATVTDDEYAALLRAVDGISLYHGRIHEGLNLHGL